MSKIRSVKNLPENIESIVFDLDSTLVYSSHDGKDFIGKYQTQSITFRSFDDTGDVTMIIALRPGIDELFASLGNTKIGIWSMGKPNYVKAVCELLPLCNLQFVWDWTHCHRDRWIIYKPLSASPFDVETSCIIEDRLSCCDVKDSNIIVVEFEAEDDEDDCLSELYTLLMPRLSSIVPLLYSHLGHHNRKSSYSDVVRNIIFQSN